MYHALRFIAIISISLSVSLPGFQTAAQQPNSLPSIPENWTRPYHPFRIAGNLFYVGTEDLACYLITTPAGHILINTGVSGSEGLIEKNIRSLGFRCKDLRILLTTQAHFDHVGAMAALKKATGAKMMVDEKDAAVLADGGNSDYIFGGKGPLFTPVLADRLLCDRDTVKLGGVAVVMLHHPGHTKGSCSFIVDVKDKKRSYRVLIANMPSILAEAHFPTMASYPEIENDFAYTLRVMKTLQFDIWLASHGSQFGLLRKHQAGAPYKPESFIDRAGYDAAIKLLQREYLKKAAGGRQRNLSLAQIFNAFNTYANEALLPEKPNSKLHLV